MSLALFATSTQDGLMLAVTALGCALLSRSLDEGRSFKTSALAAAACCFAMVAMAKLVYAPFCLLLLATPVKRIERYAAFTTAVLASLLWTGWMFVAVAVPLINPGANPADQVTYLASHPEAVLPIAVQTLERFTAEYWASFVGVLGWLDTPLPTAYYWITACVLVIAVAISTGGAVKRSWGMLAACAVALLLSIGAVFAAVYIQWSPVSAPIVTGVQGRYFLPAALLLSVALAAAGTTGSAFIPRVLKAAVLIFPLLSLAVLAQAVVGRFYGAGPIPQMWAGPQPEASATRSPQHLRSRPS